MRTMRLSTLGLSLVVLATTTCYTRGDDDSEDNWSSSIHAEVEEAKQAAADGGVAGFMRYITDKRDAWKKIPLNIAVIGNSGVGKSSFINAIRRMTADDDGAAKVGEKETTVKIEMFPHPDNPMMKFWDLPGVGTGRFPKSSYIRDVDINKYDFFILISATRFTENDIWLGNEIMRLRKGFFFVRTKVENDIDNNKKAHPKTHNEKEVIRNIRESTSEHLKRNGCGHISMFLIDSYETMKYDFNDLEQRLIRDFPGTKRSALIMSLRVNSKEMIKRKVEVLKENRWKAAALSAAIGAIPVPGVASVMFDGGLVMAEALTYVKQLGLDDQSLNRLASQMKADIDDLKRIVNKGASAAVKNVGVSGIKSIVAQLPTVASKMIAQRTLTEASRFIPFIGSLIAAPINYSGTYYVLTELLGEMESEALEIIDYVTKHVEKTYAHEEL